MLYGTPNMHMHCHLASCVKEFGPIHSFWLFPFERYNGILEGQPSNNRSIELQLMRRFLKDNMHLQLQHEAQHWPNAAHFLEVLPNPTYDSSIVHFDSTAVLGSKSVVGSLDTDNISCLRTLYATLYPAHASSFLDNRAFIPSTFKKYYTIKWKGKNLISSFNKNAKNTFVFVSPPFPFTTSHNTSRSDLTEERLAEIVFSCSLCTSPRYK